MKKALILATFVMTLVGCASVTMGDAKQDVSLKTFAIAPDKSAVYIYRNESFGAGVKMSVTVDGQMIGQTAAQTYLYKELSPGKHTVTSIAENDSTVVVDAKVGTLQYVWQEVKMGLLYARTQLSVVGEDVGQKGVLESKLAETK